MSNNNEHQEIREAIARFIGDFNNLEMTKVASHFADDATMFPRVVMADTGTTGVVLADYCREDGPGPFQSMEKFATDLRAKTAGPPYMSLKPSDINIQLFGETAVVTFHLKDTQRLARRTIVFVKQDNNWKIIHLHASNVQASR